MRVDNFFFNFFLSFFEKQTHTQGTGKDALTQKHTIISFKSYDNF